MSGCMCCISYIMTSAVNLILCSGVRTRISTLCWHRKYTIITTDSTFHMPSNVKSNVWAYLIWPLTFFKTISQSARFRFLSQLSCQHLVSGCAQFTGRTEMCRVIPPFALASFWCNPKYQRWQEVGWSRLPLVFVFQNEVLRGDLFFFFLIFILLCHFFFS